MAWQRYLFYTRTSTRTTWRFRLAVLAVLVLAAAATHNFWTAKLARNLVCGEEVVPSDVILVENFDPDYLVFERAARLQVAGIAPKALVPVRESRNPGVPNPVSRGIADVMARQSRLAAWEALPIQDVEPITLNAAFQLREHLVREGVRSLLVVTGGFRSRRSTMAYRAVLGPAGIEVHCVPVFGLKTPETWTQSWHGVQEFLQETVKLQYYKYYVLPFVLANGRDHGRSQSVARDTVAGKGTDSTRHRESICALRQDRVSLECSHGWVRDLRWRSA